VKETVKKEQEAKELDTVEALEKFLDGHEDSLSEEEEQVKQHKTMNNKDLRYSRLRKTSMKPAIDSLLVLSCT
jgi:hypothetical protein